MSHRERKSDAQNATEMVPPRQKNTPKRSDKNVGADKLLGYSEARSSNTIRCKQCFSNRFHISQFRILKAPSSKLESYICTSPCRTLQMCWTPWKYLQIFLVQTPLIPALRQMWSLFLNIHPFFSFCISICVIHPRVQEKMFATVHKFVTPLSSSLNKQVEVVVVVVVVVVVIVAVALKAMSAVGPAMTTVATQVDPMQLGMPMTPRTPAGTPQRPRLVPPRQRAETVDVMLNVEDQNQESGASGDGSDGESDSGISNCLLQTWPDDSQPGKGKIRLPGLKTPDGERGDRSSFSGSRSPKPKAVSLPTQEDISGKEILFTVSSQGHSAVMSCRSDGARPSKRTINRPRLSSPSRFASGGWKDAKPRMFLHFNSISTAFHVLFVSWNPLEDFQDFHLRMT